MALIFLALNGDGLGHLVRITTVCHSLATLGERPVIFSQGMFPLDEHSHFPGKRVPSLWKSGNAVRHAVAAEVRSIAEISLPSVLVEDTHPNPISLPRNIRRVLLVRPAAFEHLTMLNREFGHMYSRFLLCDFPDSPTWPYSPSETESILTWKQWQIVGPIYRRTTQTDIAQVRQRYQIDNQRRLCVFSMGGGGLHVPGDTDGERFPALFTNIADRLRQIDPAARLIFVKGPYFPSNVEVSSPFEVVAQEPLMPALMGCAHGVVTRAGFNTPWECISAYTPFLPFEGTTVNEPVQARLRGMCRLGLLPDSIDQLWNDEAWREKYRQTCSALLQKCSGQPDPRLLQELILGRSENHPAASAAVNSWALPPWRREKISAQHSSRLRFAMPFVIRIDDVATTEPALAWLLRLLSVRKLRASLGVVPYFLDFESAFLDALDPDATLFEICQHGYARLPRSPLGTPWQEFSLDSAALTAEESSEIDRGRCRLQEAFPARWQGGFSAPFDAMPPGLQTFWRDSGGAFVTAIGEKQCGGTVLPVVYAGADLWDWSRERMHSLNSISRWLAHQAVRNGYAGIVLRPQYLRHPAARARLIALLDFLQDRGIATISLSQIAARTSSAKPGGNAWRNYLWAFSTRALPGRRPIVATQFSDGTS